MPGNWPSNSLINISTNQVIHHCAPALPVQRTNTSVLLSTRDAPTALADREVTATDRHLVRTTPASRPLHDPKKSILAHDNMVQPPRSTSLFNSKEVREVVIASAEQETPSSVCEGPTASMPQVLRMEQPPIGSCKIVTTSLQCNYLASSRSTQHSTPTLPV